MFKRLSDFDVGDKVLVVKSTPVSKGHMAGTVCRVDNISFGSLRLVARLKDNCLMACWHQPNEVVMLEKGGLHERL